MSIIAAGRWWAGGRPSSALSTFGHGRRGTVCSGRLGHRHAAPSFSFSLLPLSHPVLRCPALMCRAWLDFPSDLAITWFGRQTKELLAVLLASCSYQLSVCVCNEHQQQLVFILPSPFPCVPYPSPNSPLIHQVHIIWKQSRRLVMRLAARAEEEREDWKLLHHVSRRRQNVNWCHQIVLCSYVMSASW